ncbi:hypothetical protein CHH83_05755 [Bacillus sp. 7586-K]|nr:hypothetical protein CHH83_05755 [Bacillus sp. 7586-K]
MKLVEKVLINELKKDPIKVQNMVLNMETLDLKTRSQILALAMVYEQPESHELRSPLRINNSEVRK